MTLNVLNAQKVKHFKNQNQDLHFTQNVALESNFWFEVGKFFILFSLGCLKGLEAVQKRFAISLEGFLKTCDNFKNKKPTKFPKKSRDFCLNYDVVQEKILSRILKYSNQHSIPLI